MAGRRGRYPHSQGRHSVGEAVEGGGLAVSARKGGGLAQQPALGVSGGAAGPSQTMSQAPSQALPLAMSCPAAPPCPAAALPPAPPLLLDLAAQPQRCHVQPATATTGGTLLHQKFLPSFIPRIQTWVLSTLPECESNRSRETAQCRPTPMQHAPPRPDRLLPGLPSTSSLPSAHHTCTWVL